MNDFRTKVLRKIAEVPPEEWKGVFPDVSEGYHFLKTLDESSFEQFKFRYILVYGGARLVGCAPCFLMGYPLETTVQGPLRWALSLLRRVAPNIAVLKVVVCGIPTGEGRIGIAGDNEAVLRAICEGLEDIARDEGACVVAFKDFGQDYTKYLYSPLLKKGFFRTQDFPSTIMDVNFASFEDYLKSLSRSSREGLKRKLKKIDGRAKVDFEVAGFLEGEVLRDAYRLYLETNERHEVGFEILPLDFFENLPKNMPEETKYFLWRIEGRLVAFTLALVSRDYFMDYNLGFDYGVALKYHLYFVRFRDLMKWCIENGIKRYEMGPMSYESKRRLGFELITLYIYARHRSKLLNPFFKILCSLLKPENFEPAFKYMKRARQRSNPAIPA